MTTFDRLLIQTPSQVASEEVSSTESLNLNPFTMLPLELFDDILRELLYADYMAMKFVCRSFHAATFYADGREVVDLKAITRVEVAEQLGKLILSSNGLFFIGYHGFPTSQVAKYILNCARTVYHLSLIKIEASYSGPLYLLTCGLCGRRKAHGQFGFCDKQFNQTLYSRRCLDCQLPAAWGKSGIHDKYRINGIHVMRCGSCRKICPSSRRLTRSGVGIPEHQCGQDLGLLS